jgi:hypothetical protein
MHRIEMDKYDWALLRMWNSLAHTMKTPLKETFGSFETITLTIREGNTNWNQSFYKFHTLLVSWLMV